MLWFPCRISDLFLLFLCSWCERQGYYEIAFWRKQNRSSDHHTFFLCVPLFLLQIQHLFFFFNCHFSTVLFPCAKENVHLCSCQSLSQLTERHMSKAGVCTKNFQIWCRTQKCGVYVQLFLSSWMAKDIAYNGFRCYFCSGLLWIPWTHSSLKLTEGSIPMLHYVCSLCAELLWPKLASLSYYSAFGNKLLLPDFLSWKSNCSANSITPSTFFFVHRPMGKGKNGKRALFLRKLDP